ncbi:Uncharacterised protein [Legionella beliardensis]|uniref:Leucine-rich repeat domain-containing protein n=1 Tax=Legionella beliardensis TaxID=91822 RepID=A0A378HZM1_9GAMM|nr:leucine-rich repeat domain-containing protein [Legionella beliardensis]STX27910.1 Uncharacterised protein [Legionella beliardensis]
MPLSADGKILLKVDESNIIDGFYEIPAGVTTIGVEAFAKVSSLKTLALLGIKTIRGGHLNHSHLPAMMLLAGITDIGVSAFKAAGIRTMGWGGFFKCSSLQTIVIPAGITGIHARAFRGCSNLQTITLPVGLKAIGTEAFSECSSLQTITLPAGVRDIKYDAFLGCDKLTRIIIDSDDQAELERLNALLPYKLTSKIIAKSLYDEVIRLQEKQLARILFSPQTNQLYRFFHVDTQYVSKVNVENDKKQIVEKTCPTLPEEIFCHINNQGTDANLYYQKAKILIGREPWPTTPEELKGYEEKLIKIVNKCIKQAEHFHAATEEAQIASPAAPLN